MGLNSVEYMLRLRAPHEEEASDLLRFFERLTPAQQVHVERIAKVYGQQREDATLAELERVADEHTTDVLKALKRDKSLEVVDRPGRGLKT